MREGHLDQDPAATAQSSGADGQHPAVGRLDQFLRMEVNLAERLALLPEVVRTAPVVRRRRVARQSAATRPRLASEPGSRVALSLRASSDNPLA